MQRAGFARRVAVVLQSLCRLKRKNNSCEAAMGNCDKFVVTFYIVQRDNSERFFLYGNSFRHPRTDTLVHEERPMPLGLQDHAVNLDLVTVQMLLTESEHSDFLNGLHSNDPEGRFTESIAKKLELSEQPKFLSRPDIYQFDSNTTNLQSPYSTEGRSSESIAPMLSIVKTFWTFQKIDRLVLALG
jgi:hypothetical protein